MSNLAMERLKKINFIKEFCPNYRTIDPYMDVSVVDEITHGLYESGLYKNSNRHVASETVIRLILEAQGRKGGVSKHAKARNC